MRERNSPRSVLVVGSGGREHALVWALRRSPSVGTLYAAPGNPGIAQLAEIVPISADDIHAIADWSVERAVDLVVVGPEAPLAAGLADLLMERSTPVFGPTRAAAELEWSKTFAKRFLSEHAIPTPGWAVFTDADTALAHAARADYPLVVKADGLAAGKGVTVCASFAEAAAAIRAALVEGAFGEAGRRVIVEEFVTGKEVSVIALCDGERIACLPPARDHKRLGADDTGPNTGGMGAYAPVPELDEVFLHLVEETILQPTVDGLRAMGRPYRGALYAGLMLGPTGPQVLEFNCRFGDPETQAMLPLLEGDFAEILLACAEGQLDPTSVCRTGGSTTCLTLAAPGYPICPELGGVVRGIVDAEATGALVFHAGTVARDDEVVAGGGRVVSVVGRGADLQESTERAYAAAARIEFPGKQMRPDIGAPQLALAR
ncbi:MAG: phosphoribosylamine--glycine ligase [Thermomicrobiales bacterium]|nr:phosphoribosylamine--glycine ligase [Thermomicrobiales bacterium]